MTYHPVARYPAESLSSSLLGFYSRLIPRRMAASALSQGPENRLLRLALTSHSRPANIKKNIKM